MSPTLRPDWKCGNSSIGLLRKYEPAKISRLWIFKYWSWEIDRCMILPSYILVDILRSSAVQNKDKDKKDKLTWKAALRSCMSETKMPVPVALWLPSMIMMPRPWREVTFIFIKNTILIAAINTRRIKVMVNDHEDNHQLALVDPQLSLGSELFELFRLKDLQIILVKQQASWGTWLVVIIRRRG